MRGSTTIKPDHLRWWADKAGSQTAVLLALEIDPAATVEEISRLTTLSLESVRAAMRRVKKQVRNDQPNDDDLSVKSDQFERSEMTNDARSEMTKPRARSSSHSYKDNTGTPTQGQGVNQGGKELQRQDQNQSQRQDQNQNQSQKQTLSNHAKNGPKVPPSEVSAASEFEADLSTQLDPAATEEDSASGSGIPNTSKTAPRFTLTPGPMRPKGRPVNAALEAVWEAWKASTGHARAVLDGNRRTTLQRALDTYGSETCLAAVRGIQHSDWHMGRDPKTDGKTYNTIQFIFRSADNIEKFAALDTTAASTTEETQTYEDAHAEWMEHYCAFLTKTLTVEDVLPTEPASAKLCERFKEFPPTGYATHLGERVLVFEDVLMNTRSMNLAASGYASERLLKAHPRSAMCLELTKTAKENCKLEVLEQYAANVTIKHAREKRAS